MAWGITNNICSQRDLYLEADVPGALANLTFEIAALKSNILHVNHMRDAVEVSVGMTKVELILEVEDDSHAKRIRKRLKQKGFETDGGA